MNVQAIADAGFIGYDILRAVLGEPVLAAKGSMVAFQGQVSFEHKSAGSIGKMMRRLVTADRFPALAEIVASGTFDSEDPRISDEDFEQQIAFGLTMILDGVGRLIDAMDPLPDE